MVIGQPKIMSIIQNINSISQLPKVILISGEKGGGKHLICNEVSQRFNLPIEEITESISLDSVQHMTLITQPTLFLLDGDNLTSREQNAILKLLEEPYKNTFIIINCSVLTNILDTIKSRCIIWELQGYDKETLRTFIPSDVSDKELLLSVSDTPGQIIANTNTNLSQLNAMAQTLVSKISTVNVANLLKTSLSFKLKKDDTDKYDLGLFIKLLLMHISKAYENTSNEIYLKYYKLTLEFSKQFRVLNIDKRMLYENYLINMKLLAGQTT